MIQSFKTLLKIYYEMYWLSVVWTFLLPVHARIIGLPWYLFVTIILSKHTSSIFMITYILLLFLVFAFQSRGMAKYMSNITKIFANLDRFDFIQFVNRRKTLTCWHQVGHSKILLLACTCGCICIIYIVEVLQKVKTTKRVS